MGSAEEKNLQKRFFSVLKLSNFSVDSKNGFEEHLIVKAMVLWQDAACQLATFRVK